MTSTRLAKIGRILEDARSPAYLLRDIQRSIYQRKLPSYRDMTSVPLALRERIIEEMGGDESTLSLRVQRLSPSKQCVKALFRLQDGNSIESVWMQFRDSAHSSLCISSQVGCALKCNFCATGAVGFKRQLTCDEIVDQVLFFQQVAQFPNRRPLGMDDRTTTTTVDLSNVRSVDTISFMGMGEALQNPQVFRALDLLTAKDGFAMAPRRISVSTVGIIPGIVRLTERFPQVNLAFSLHSPFQEQRNVLVPANKIFPLPEIVKALEQHALKTRRKVLLAYLVLVSSWLVLSFLSYVYVYLCVRVCVLNYQPQPRFSSPDTMTPWTMPKPSESWSSRWIHVYIPSSTSTYCATILRKASPRTISEPMPLTCRGI